MIASLLPLGCLTGVLFAGPAPGDVFREYLWWNERGDAGGALRVGAQVSAHGAAGCVTPLITPAWDLDLAQASRAELEIEKILCHDGTTGLELQVNDGEWLPVPEPAGVPEPPEEYQHHFCATVPVPLGSLHTGAGNTFRLRVSPEHRWGWPQNLIYGAHLRVYYHADRVPHPTGAIEWPMPNAWIEYEEPIKCRPVRANHPIRRVDFLALCDDVNVAGDGLWRQWQQFRFHGALRGHIGTANRPRFELIWDTSWLPEQRESIALAARITDASGMTYMTAAVTGLRLLREGWSVELCKPYDVPRRWVTRSGEHAEKFLIAGDLKQAVAAQLVWSSWSPGYMNGISINGVRVFENEGPRYQYHWHRVRLDDLTCLRPGENTLTTGLTPKHNGQMVHGMEVNWPGIMVLVQYED